MPGTSDAAGSRCASWLGPAPIGIEEKPVLQVAPADGMHVANLPGGHQGARVLHLGKPSP